MAKRVAKTVLVEQVADGVRQFTLHRPDALNALNSTLMGELRAAFDAARDDDTVRTVVLTGGTKVFAAGADIKEMAALDVVGSVLDKRIANWLAVRRFPKPIVAAVNGYALGGGCELAMHADVIIAGDNAVFGQPEVNLGLIPGAGGTQRIVRSIGKSRAMKMILSSEFMDADEALTAGLVAEVRPHEASVGRAVALAATIASKPPVAIRLAKEAVLKSFETPLEAGLDFERRAFNILFGTADRQEGIAAFVEKRKPKFTGR
ncbi:MAG: enoyl-CoA hydratase-related protein [Alphaproteobacteria bacterium]|nr:enoyl-CoA hydratase-related protein [Alphaproteobacteria bacterium]